MKLYQYKRYTCKAKIFKTMLLGKLSIQPFVDNLTYIS